MKKETTVEIFENICEDGNKFYTLKSDGHFWERHSREGVEIMKLEDLSEVFCVVEYIIHESIKYKRAKHSSRVNVIHHKEPILA